MQLEFIPSSAITAEASKEIEAFLDSRSNSDLDIFQYPQWSTEGLCAIYRSGGKICWFTLVSTVYPLAILKWIRTAELGRGPFCDDLAMWREGCAQLSDKLRREGYAYLHMQPAWTEEPQSNAGHDAAWIKSDSGRYSMRLKLNLSNDDLFEGFRKTTRYDIRRATREGVEVDIPKSSDDLQEYLRIYEKLEKDRNFGIRAANVVQRIQWLIDSGRGTLLLARHQGDLMGGAVLARTGHLCTYVWGATTKAEKFSAGQLLQWKALQWAKSAGCTEYDFGNYWPGATKGPYWFKAGFGGTPVYYVATRYIVLNPVRCQIIFQSQRLRGYTRRVSSWMQRFNSRS
ncbi:MAG TPA: GNAT family N-acetyltransferase [Terriglobales bacterium]|nr:GNAT family N-acetyltransferase [Terriglobales bacterium]